MKILFLHLSDMHISDRKGFNSFQIDKIADAMNTRGPVDRVIILVSGDLAKSGKAFQYYTVKRCIGRLISTYKTKYAHNAFIDVLCVPGNHDMDYNGNCINSAELQSIRKSGAYESRIQGQVEMQKAFFEYAKFNQSFLNDKLYSREILNYNNFIIEVNMLNSGVFSILDEDKGLHYIPQYCINELNTPSGANFVITIMHHAPDWYTDSIKNQLEAAIYEKSSIVFFGHEHQIGNKQISHEDLPAAVIQAGGTLCMNDNWMNSSFYIGILDSCDYKYTYSKFSWKSVQKQYEEAELRSKTLPPKPSTEKRICVCSEYEKELRKDLKHERL